MALDRTSHQSDQDTIGITRRHAADVLLDPTKRGGTTRDLAHGTKLPVRDPLTGKAPPLGIE
jgi:hypothetical protein